MLPPPLLHSPVPVALIFDDKQKLKQSIKRLRSPKKLPRTQPDFSSIFYIFQKLGTSLRAQARSQINIQMRKVADVKPAEGLRDIVFPFVWFSDGIETIDDATTVSLLHSAVHTPEKARSAL